MKFQPVVALFVLLCLSLELNAQTTAFTYQGKLSDSGSAANGNYDFRFRLFDANTNAVTGPITNLLLNVTNGQFTATLNFGSGIFDGSDRWLEVAVRSNGTAFPFIPLAPLQPVTSVPYAIQSLNAANASTATNAQNAANATKLVVALPGTNISGTIPIVNLPTNVAFLNSNQFFSASNTFSGVVTATNGANNFAGAFSGTFSGNGGNLTNIAATNLRGILPDARLSSNVALQSNVSLTFSGSVTATNFTGSGHGLTNVPGAFFWVTVAGTSAQSFPNVGYICTNDITPVTITLPSSPSVGDTFKVAGTGGAGWIIAQNAGQTIFSGNLSASIGQSWKTNAPSANWSGIASSADGTKLVAVINGGTIYTSGNSGAGWTQRASGLGNLNWSSVASSSDGSKLVATVGYSIYNAAGSGQIYTSTDSGANWTGHGSSLQWSCSASSADGSKIVAAVRGGSVYTNSGTTWSAVAATSGGQWNSVATSADGSKIVAVDANGFVYASINSGSTWVDRTNINSLDLTAVTSSSDGNRLIITTSGGQIYISTDAGVTWNQGSSSVSGQLTAVASSADGSRFATTAGGSALSGNIYGSSDSGATWAQFVGAPFLSWSGIASSADGSQMAATVHGGPIYISSQNSTTTGATGYLSGTQHGAIELIYTGNGNFLPLNHEGTIRAY